VKVVQPYIASLAGEPSAVPNSVLLLDCWPVHIGEEFRTYMAETHPNIALLFVPAGTTGKAQPIDLVVNKPFKDAGAVVAAVRGKPPGSTRCTDVQLL
jgi:hypothetical protein